MKDKILGGALYIATFIDDFIRKLWCFAMIFTSFHASAERETRRKLKYIHANNGCAYRHRFEQYCHEHGIRIERSVPKTPHHNGVVDRRNRTICKQIKYMLTHSKLPKSFRGEAMRTIVYLINLSPPSPLNGNVSERALKIA